MSEPTDFKCPHKISVSLSIQPASQAFSMEMSQWCIVLPGSLFLYELTIATISYECLQIMNSFVDISMPEHF